MSQERQRLETILSLCSELGRAEVDVGATVTNSTSAVADLRKINQELQKLQVTDDSDDDGLSVFSDSLTVNGTTERRHRASQGSENGYYDDLQVRCRRSSGHPDSRAESPAVTLRNFAPSPSPRTQRPHEVQKPPLSQESFRINMTKFHTYSETTSYKLNPFLNNRTMTDF